MESTTGISTPPEEVDNLIQVKRRVVWWMFGCDAVEWCVVVQLNNAVLYCVGRL